MIPHCSGIDKVILELHLLPYFWFVLQFFWWLQDTVQYSQELRMMTLLFNDDVNDNYDPCLVNGEDTGDQLGGDH